MSHTNADSYTTNEDVGEKTYSLTATLEDFRYLNAMFAHYKKHACKFCYKPLNEDIHAACGATA